MHSEGIEERIDGSGSPQWFVRSECRGCGLRVGVEVPAGEPSGLVDRMMWTDEALHRLERMPPYLAELTRDDIERCVRAGNGRVVTYDRVLGPLTGERIEWEPEAERRLDNVPPAVRAMARIELERTAVERGTNRITVALMEEVKARYFGMGAAKNAR
jgi:hypothetical protein